MGHNLVTRARNDDASEPFKSALRLEVRAAASEGVGTPDHLALRAFEILFEPEADIGFL